MKILCLLVRHGTTAYPSALPDLDAWYDRHQLLGQRELWVIDNARPPAAPPEALGPRTQLRSGDNAAWEFSAWTRALAEARAERVTFDAVHCVTSAFRTLYTGYLADFAPWMLAYATTWNACLGHIDALTGPARTGDDPMPAWIRTAFFFLPRTVVDRCASFATWREPDRLFAGPGERDFRPEAGIPVIHARSIRDWLEGREIGGHVWHSPIGAGPEENARFQHKAMAILNERHLSAQLVRLGVPLVDLAWLHSFAGRPLPEVPGPADLAQQLAVRRRRLGIPPDGNP